MRYLREIEGLDTSRDRKVNYREIVSSQKIREIVTISFSTTITPTKGRRRRRT
jgi:hypothetical protein